MAFTSPFYLLVFLTGAFVLYTLTPMKWKRWSLLAVSLAYYFVCSKALIAVLLLTVGVVYLGGIWLGRIQDAYDLAKPSLDRAGRKALREALTWQKKAVIVLMLLSVLGALLALKYAGFFAETANGLLALAGRSGRLPVPALAMPLGISFYTLQALGYLVDVYRGKYPPSRDIGQVALFLCFFPQTVEGPIGRFDLMGEQLVCGHPFDYNRVAFACQRILFGLFKTLVLADRANMLVTRVFDGSERTGIEVLAGILIYTLQIYADFSGSIDLVLGSAQLFGVELSENFRQPFRARTVNEFWQRWHITLGSWLRDYIFYPLSMSAAFKSVSKWAKGRLNPFLGSLVPAAFALFFVWLANGFWHGASWKYIAYGMYYYVIILLGMLFEPLFQTFFAKTGIDREGRAFAAWQIARTFLLVNLGMLLFRADMLGQAWTLLTGLFRANWLEQLRDGVLLELGLDVQDWCVLAVGTALLWLVGHLKEGEHRIREELAARPLAVRWCCYLALLAAVVLLGAYGEGYETVGFIYAQF